MTYKETYRLGVHVLKEADILEAELDARLLLEFVCNTDRNTLLAHGDRSVSKAENESYVNLLQKRQSRIPIQQIIGTQEFMGLSFLVNENVLIPRQDTENLVEEVMLHLHDGMKILDVCTGSGCILLSLLKYSNDCFGVGTDISDKALEVAKQNKERLGLSAEFIQGDLFEALKHVSCNLAEHKNKFDIIVSNPPYIASDVIQTLMPEVREHEPVLALDGGLTGLDFYKRIINDVPEYLNKGGMLFFEIGFDQGEAVKSLMENAGYKCVTIKKDFAGLDRIVYGTY